MKDPDGNKDGDTRQYLLVLRCQAGDEDAFRTLYELYSDRTLRYLKGLLDESSAWDIQQEAWLKAYQQISELMNPDGFRTWLYRIVHRHAIDHLRSKKRRQNLRESASDELEIQQSAEKADQLFELKDPVDLSSLLDQLKPLHRDVIMLKYWEGMRYEEIALITGSPVGTVRSRIYYAKQKIQELLEQDESK